MKFKANWGTPSTQTSIQNYATNITHLTLKSSVYHQASSNSFPWCLRHCIMSVRHTFPKEAIGSSVACPAVKQRPSCAVFFLSPHIYVSSASRSQINSFSPPFPQRTQMSLRSLRSDYRTVSWWRSPGLLLIHSPQREKAWWYFECACLILLVKHL